VRPVRLVPTEDGGLDVEVIDCANGTRGAGRPNTSATTPRNSRAHVDGESCPPDAEPAQRPAMIAGDHREQLRGGQVRRVAGPDRLADQVGTIAFLADLEPLHAADHRGVEPGAASPQRIAIGPSLIRGSLELPHPSHKVIHAASSGPSPSCGPTMVARAV